MKAWNVIVLLSVAALLTVHLIETTAQDRAKGQAETKGQGEAKGWMRLFEREKWYKDAKGKEQIFQGKLQAIPNAGGLSSLQRDTYYRLGKRTLFTRAKKSKTLDNLVGKAVEIRGRAVDFELEGQSLREIWPAAIRVAPAKKRD